MQCQLVAPITKSRTVSTAGLISCRSALVQCAETMCSRRPLADKGSLVVPRSLQLGCTKQLQTLGGTDDALNAVDYGHIQEADLTCL